MESEHRLFVGNFFFYNNEWKVDFDILLSTIYAGKTCLLVRNSSIVWFLKINVTTIY